MSRHLVRHPLELPTLDRLVVQQETVKAVFEIGGAEGVGWTEAELDFDYAGADEDGWGVGEDLLQSIRSRQMIRMHMRLNDLSHAIPPLLHEPRQPLCRLLPHPSGSEIEVQYRVYDDRFEGFGADHEEGEGRGGGVEEGVDEGGGGGEGGGGVGFVGLERGNEGGRARILP